MLQFLTRTTPVYDTGGVNIDAYFVSTPPYKISTNASAVLSSALLHSSSGSLDQESCYLTYLFLRNLKPTICRVLNTTTACTTATTYQGYFYSGRLGPRSFVLVRSTTVVDSEFEESMYYIKHFPPITVLSVPPRATRKNRKNVGYWLHHRPSLRLYCQWIRAEEWKFKHHASKFDTDLVIQTLHVLR